MKASKSCTVLYLCLLDQFLVLGSGSGYDRFVRFLALGRFLGGADGLLHVAP